MKEEIHILGLVTVDDDNNNGTATTLDLRTTLVGDKIGSESEGKA